MPSPKPRDIDFDLIVLGSGAGGGVASHIAASMGKRVAIVENDTIGGECPNFGCVPTKSLLQAAEVYTTIQEAADYGISTGKVQINYNTIHSWKTRAVHRTGTYRGEEVYKDEGIIFVRGKAHFINPWTITIGTKRLTAHKFLIATGTYSIIPPIPGLKETGFMTYREAIDFKKPPASLFVIGGGAIGCEFAHLFHAFGTKVTIADIAPRLLGREEAEAAELLKSIFEERGIKVLTESKVVKVSKSGKDKIVHYEQNGAIHTMKVEEILVASGKAPNTDLGLENAGVTYGKHGIKVNRFMRTRAKHIFAAGDVVGPYQFTHTASYQSRVAAHNMFHWGKRVAAQYHAVPRCVFVDPEIASVGVTEQELIENKVAHQVSVVPISIIGRANTSNVSTGFVKVLADQKGTLIGASIVSPRAGEMIHELTLAIQHRMKARAINETIHAFPTWSEAVRLACSKIKSS